MATNFKFNNGGNTADFTDVFIPRAAFSQGGLWAWGANGYGQLGTNNQTAYSSPVQSIASGVNWKQVSNNTYGTSAGIKTDGTLWTWGKNALGQLGDNTIASKSSPIQTIAGGNNWKQVATGNGSQAVCGAIKTDGTLWLWGYNGFGNLGDSTAVNKSSPVQTIAGGTNWKQVSIGLSTFGHAGAIKTDGTLWFWGRNYKGEAGTSANVGGSYNSPIQTIAAGTNWKQLSCGDTFSTAIKTDGTLWVWGQNNQGQLGDNTVVHKSSPVQTISGGTNWKQVAAGGFNCAAIKTDGTLWMWGYNNIGQLGDNTIDRKSSPVQTIAGGTNWREITCSHSGNAATAAIKTDGTLWMWGSGSAGVLGGNNSVAKSSPVQTIAGGTNWKQVSVGDSTTLAITDIF